MNAALDLFRNRGKKPSFTPKFAGILAGIPLIATIAWLLLPSIFGLISSTIPSLWISLRSSAAPPYLFIAVNFIILMIWKLSQNRVFHADQPPEEESLFDTDDVISLVSSPKPHLYSKTSQDDFRKISPAEEEASPAPASESSCMTTVSEEKSTASSSSLAGICADAKEDPAVADERDENASLDATWSALARCSGRWESNDVQKQRFDDFIKMNYDQFRSRKPGIKLVE